MATIKIYRKDSGKNPPKVSATMKADVERKLALFSKVRRPSLESFFIPAKAGTKSDFYKLPALPQHVIDNAPMRIYEFEDAGWLVPEDSQGRNPGANRSNAQSILLWIKQRLADVVNPEDVSVVVE